MKITKRQLIRIIKEQMAIVDVPKDIQDRIAKIQDPLDREALEDGVDEVLGGEKDLSDLEGWLEDIESGGGLEAMKERKTSHMKVTKRQLRRIIREAMVTKGTPYSRSPDAEMAAAAAERGAAGMPQNSPIENSIQRALEMNPVMSGTDLIDHVIQDIPGQHVWHQRVADFMDEMLEDDLLSWDVEEDEWRLA
jgi:hypothetical protein